MVLFALLQLRTPADSVQGRGDDSQIVNGLYRGHPLPPGTLEAKRTTPLIARESFEAFGLFPIWPPVVLLLGPCTCEVGCMIQSRRQCFSSREQGQLTAATASCVFCFATAHMEWSDPARVFASIAPFMRRRMTLCIWSLALIQRAHLPHAHVVARSAHLFDFSYTRSLSLSPSSIVAYLLQQNYKSAAGGGRSCYLNWRSTPAAKKHCEGLARTSCVRGLRTRQASALPLPRLSSAVGCASCPSRRQQPTAAESQCARAGTAVQQQRIPRPWPPLCHRWCHRARAGRGYPPQATVAAVVVAVRLLLCA
eukprot:COSAG01_NODE_5094_length_4491_cov_4.165301_2_plen_309_part_00